MKMNEIIRNWKYTVFFMSKTYLGTGYFRFDESLIDFPRWSVHLPNKGAATRPAKENADMTTPV